MGEARRVSVDLRSAHDTVVDGPLTLSVSVGIMAGRSAGYDVNGSVSMGWICQRQLWDLWIEIVGDVVCECLQSR